MLSQNLSEFFDTSLHLNCPQISLRKELINSQEIYQGSGSITRTSEGQLELKLSYFSEISLIQNEIYRLPLSNSFRDRLTGCLNSMKSVRAKDRLRNLMDKGLLDKKLVDAWNKVRNKTAHGYVLEPEKFVENQKLSNQVTVLFNHLVFLAIGYLGKYTDYSEDGWIKKDYNRNSN